MAYLFDFPNNRSHATNADGSVMLDDDEEPVVVRTPVRPLRFITDDLLPVGNAKHKNLRKFYRDYWRPILGLMHDANRARIANCKLDEINNDFLEETYTAGVEALKNKYPELFEGANATRCQIWAISNWNKELRAAQCKRRRAMN